MLSVVHMPTSRAPGGLPEPRTCVITARLGVPWGGRMGGRELRARPERAWRRGGLLSGLRCYRQHGAPVPVPSGSNRALKLIRQSGREERRAGRRVVYRKQELLWESGDYAETERRLAWHTGLSLQHRT